MPVIKLTNKLFDRFRWIKPGDNDVINICDKDNTILCCNKFKDIRFIDIVDYHGYDVIEEQKYFDPIEDKYIIFVIIDK